ncbi:hypothetical protein MMA15_13785 [Streptomyces sp. M600PL45_2]|uniref:Uncharacterized protein n=1 Tax=Streptomyces marispadix TaxID=2922868 RepID=A0ABS9SYQ9_9ACTN|nr:hypothetical protein [Streptomyces marispadix]
MTHRANAPGRLCRCCYGFPVVAVTTGQLHDDGSRVTFRVACPACRGTGKTKPRRNAPAAAGGRA